jgi:MFS family permease
VSSSRDFWTFWTGQTISQFGSSITLFVLPLLVFRLTGSAFDLGIAMAVGTAPYLLFGLVIGAWTDRVDRKRLMIVTDTLRGIVVASIPVAAGAGVLSIWWIYVVLFVNTTLSIAFESAEFGVVPALVSRDDLVGANGRIQASFQAASIAGPLAGGALLAIVPLGALVSIDAATFFVSAISIGAIARELHLPRQGSFDVRRDVAEGLRYVLRHPVLRNISAMMALVNFVTNTAFAQLVLFAKVRFAATDSEVGLLFSASSLGVVVMSLAAGPLRKRWTFGTVALGALMVSGLLTTAVAIVPWFGLAVVVWALRSGIGALFNINTGSLRQSIVPERLLGRIMSVAMVLAWSANPLGSIVGGYVIERTGEIAAVYAAIGLISFGIALVFYLFSPLGHAERYLAAEAEPA